MSDLSNKLWLSGLALLLAAGFDASAAQEPDPVGTQTAAVNVSDNPGQSLYPVIKTSSDGSIHIAWMDASPGNWDVFYSQWNGESWSAPQNISNNETQSEHPDLAVDSTGQVHIAWMDGKGDNYFDIFYSKRTGANWSSPENLSTNNGVSQCPQLAIATSGVVHVLWWDNGSGAYDILHCTLENATASRPSATHLMEWYITNNPDLSMAPAVAAVPNGYIHVAWVGMEDVPSKFALTQNVRHSYWDGKGWSKRDNVSRKGDMTADMEHPGIVADARGTLHYVWADRDRVWYCQFDGHNWSTPRLLDPTRHPTVLPVVCATNSRQVYCAWTRVVEGEPQLLYRRINGQEWSKVLNLSEMGDETFGCTIAVDDSGAVHVAYMSHRGDMCDVIYQRLPTSE